jgi:hypothetical protein
VSIPTALACSAVAGGQLALLLGTTGNSGDPSAADAVLRESSRVAATRLRATRGRPSNAAGIPLRAARLKHRTLRASIMMNAWMNTLSK